MAAAGVPVRVAGVARHRDFKTTMIYADYQPGAGEAGSSTPPSRHPPIRPPM